MEEKISEALKGMGYSLEDITEVIHAIDPKIFNEYDGFDVSTEDVQKMLKIICYVYVAQNIYSGLSNKIVPGVLTSDCFDYCGVNEKDIDILSQFGLIERVSFYRLNTVRVCGSARKISKLMINIDSRNLNRKGLVEVFEKSNPIALLALQSRTANGNYTLPKVFIPGRYVSYFVERYNAPLLYSLPFFNREISDECEGFSKKMAEFGVAVTAHDFRSTGGGTINNECYVFPEEITELVNPVANSKASKVIKEKIESIERDFQSKRKALSFLLEYQPDKYKHYGIREYADVQTTIIDYLNQFRRSAITVSKKLSVQGFEESLPFYINDRASYSSELEKFRADNERDAKEKLSKIIQETKKIIEDVPLDKPPDKPPIADPDLIPGDEDIPPILVSIAAEDILVGFECGTGTEVRFDPAHLFISGITRSGKTTTLEAIVHRSGLSTVSFITKQGEECFKKGNNLKPFFQEKAEWKHLENIFKVQLNEKMKDIRPILIELCNNKDTLELVKGEIDNALQGKLKSSEKKPLILLQAYFKDLFDALKGKEYSSKFSPIKGINLMNLTEYSEALQGFIINSVLNEILSNRKNTVVIIPEAWKFVPQSKKTPCHNSIENLTRQGATNKNFVWFDSQDIAGVDKGVLKNVGIWILGLQTEKNEVEHTIEQIPLPKKQKPAADEVMTLKTGEFIVCSANAGGAVKKTYVMPESMEKDEAIEIAKSRKPLNMAN